MCLSREGARGACPPGPGSLGSPGGSPGPATCFSVAEKNGSRAKARERRNGAGSPRQERRGGWHRARRKGSGGGGDPGRSGGRGGTGRGEVCARRLTKKGGAARSLPVRPLRAPPREPCSPAAPSGSPAPPPPPLWEATWTCRFGPLARSRPGAGSGRSGGPLLRSPPPLRGPQGLRAALARSARGTRPGHVESERRRGRSSPRGRAVREREPGGGASASGSDRPRAAEKFPAGVRQGRRAAPGHARWKVFKGARARPCARSRCRAAELDSLKPTASREPELRAGTRRLFPRLGGSAPAGHASICPGLPAPEDKHLQGTRRQLSPHLLMAERRGSADRKIAVPLTP